MSSESPTFWGIHLVAVESSKGLCSPGQGHGASYAFRLCRRPEWAAQASAHQTLKDLHWKTANVHILSVKMQFFKDKLCGKERRREWGCELNLKRPSRHEQYYITVSVNRRLAIKSWRSIRGYFRSHNTCSFWEGGEKFDGDRIWGRACGCLATFYSLTWVVVTRWSPAYSSLKRHNCFGWFSVFALACMIKEESW